MNNISHYYNRLDILNETAQQIIKDFGMNGIAIPRILSAGNTENAYRELFSQILLIVEKLEKENLQNFYNLMYSIDISEIQIKKAVEDSKDKSFSEVVADLILKRELLKVIFRKQYSK